MKLSSQEEILTLWMHFLEGNENAFSELYCLLFDELVSYGCRVGGTRKMAEDLLQDLFLELYQKKIVLRDNGKLRPFMYRALRNSIYNQLARESRLQSFDEHEIPFDLSYTINEELLPKAAPELSQELKQLLNGLTSRQKEVIYLRFVREMSFEEIAEVMDIHVQSTRNLLTRSLNKIRNESDLAYFLLILLFLR